MGMAAWRVIGSPRLPNTHRDGVQDMTLRETIHQSIDRLENDALAVIYEQIKLLEMTAENRDSPERVPSIEEVWELTSADKSSWSDAVSADREDRL